ncbi:hypothetical protein HPB48_008822 [Haemaphysalis longicornis]|uniref:GB1/RHD3-type G domain-containing protein n=1 Tax=Haemaphysalis longicornis TaxID=44386 RepID=A0A9J6H0B1_HAELO|nr:hypothetical protein HPB48_008822 [Haemaphysalis longicornis]
MRSKGQGYWLGGTHTPLEGFPWRHGSERDTTGIVVWDELFLASRHKGDQVAVLFMDTQGAFDSDTTFQGCATIFALSTLTSSIQVYNLSQNIQENDLQYLQVFTEYGRMAQQHGGREKPFQKLVFLVRDWAHLSDAPYGEKGGRKLIARRLSTSWQKEEQKKLRHLIQSSYNEIDCFLLPYPGRQVATGQSKKGYLPDMEEEFKDHVQRFVLSVLAEEQLVTKKINCQEISFEDWVTLFSKYAGIFKEKKLPELKFYLEEIEEMRKRFFESNKNKKYNVTPFALAVPLVLSIGVSAMTFVGGPVGAVAGAAGFLIGGSSVGTMVTWFVSRTTGKITKFREGLDSTVDYTWEKMQRLFRRRPAACAGSDGQHDLDPPKENEDATTQQAETAQPVEILRITDNHTVELDVEVLRRILLADNVKNKPVVVISVAGGFRKGKSFLLDFFLRYMRSGGTSDWLDDSSLRLGRFSWREVCQRETAGILIWDDVFLVRIAPFFIDCVGYHLNRTLSQVTTSRGRELAVVFMYTQGDFNKEPTSQDSAIVFALSTMISSVQVYNLSRNIQDSDLQHLQPLNEYARLVQQDTGKEPFQKLLLLVRDWTSRQEAGYGEESGRAVFDRCLQSIERQHKELQHPRMPIQSCFRNITCFLLPHPGPKVATTLSFDGPLSDVASDFTAHLQDLVPSLLAPDNLLVKKINGHEISCQELITHFQVYVNMFMNGNPPEPKSMLEATAEASSLAAVATARDKYTSGMEQLCSGDQPHLSPALLERHHLRLRESAKELFSASQRMPEEESQQYLERLTREIDRAYASFAKRNKRKMIFAAVRTPATISIMMLAFYPVSCASALLGVPVLATLSNLLMVLSLITLCLWCYIRYSGKMREVGGQIDAIATIIWTNVLKPLCKTVIQDRKASQPLRRR